MEINAGRICDKPAGRLSFGTPVNSEKTIRILKRAKGQYQDGPSKASEYLWKDLHHALIDELVPIDIRTEIREYLRANRPK